MSSEKTQSSNIENTTAIVPKKYVDGPIVAGWDISIIAENLWVFRSVLEGVRVAKTSVREASEIRKEDTFQLRTYSDGSETELLRTRKGNVTIIKVKSHEVFTNNYSPTPLLPITWTRNASGNYNLHDTSRLRQTAASISPINLPEAQRITSEIAEKIILICKTRWNLTDLAKACKLRNNGLSADILKNQFPAIPGVLIPDFIWKKFEINILWFYRLVKNEKGESISLEALIPIITQMFQTALEQNTAVDSQKVD